MQVVTCIYADCKRFLSPSVFRRFNLCACPKVATRVNVLFESNTPPTPPNIYTAIGMLAGRISGFCRLYPKDYESPQPSGNTPRVRWNLPNVDQSLAIFGYRLSA